MPHFVPVKLGYCYDLLKNFGIRITRENNRIRKKVDRDAYESTFRKEKTVSWIEEWIEFLCDSLSFKDFPKS